MFPFDLGQRRQAPDDPVMKAVEVVMEIAYREHRNKILTYYPEEGPLRRALYPKHLAFFAAGSQYRERLMLAANRVGKTEGVGGYELTCHLTGRYPDWWVGRRWRRAVQCWASGDTSTTTRDILQKKILGPPGDFGSGLIPADCIIGTKSKPGVPDGIESVRVKHINGGVSLLQFKSYDQGREAFQGTEQDVILLDEEPPYSIYTECLLRTMITDSDGYYQDEGLKGGMIMCTFTPLLGLSETVLHFLPSGKIEETEGRRFVIMATWDDAPHLDQETKDDLWDSIPPHQRDARTKGVPQLGAGAIYPISEEEIKITPFPIPPWYIRAYSLDVGWNKTAVIWGAWDRDTDVLYLTDAYYRGMAEPAIHAEAIKSRGEWIPGVIDPAARGRSQKDGEQLVMLYRNMGLDLTEADNAVEAGIYAVWSRLSSGRLKVFSNLEDWFTEYRIYRRDESGKVVKSRDHLMDATRYLVMTGPQVASTEPNESEESPFDPYTGRSSVGGY